MNLRIKNLSLAIMLAIVMVLSSACSKAAANDAGTKKLNTAAKLIVGHNLNYFPIIVAYEKGFFKDEFGDEIQVEIPQFSNGPAQNEAITANQIDIANMGDLPTIQLWANNVDIEVISYLWDSPAGYSLVANKSSKISTLSDLKGKKVATQFGSNFHKLLLKFLAASGYTERDIEMVNLQKSESVVAIKEGVVDAILIDEPTLSNLLEDETCYQVSTAEGYDRVFTVAFGRGEYLRQNPQIVSRYLKVIQKTNEWIAQNDDEAIRIVAAFMGSDDLEGTRKYYESRNWIVGADQGLVDLLDDTIKFCKEQGLITTDGLKAENLVNGAYAKEAGIQP